MFHEYTPEEIGNETSFSMNLKMVSSKILTLTLTLTLTISH